MAGGCEQAALNLENMAFAKRRFKPPFNAVFAVLMTVLLFSLTTEGFAQQSGRIEGILYDNQPPVDNQRPVVVIGRVIASNRGQKYFAYPDMEGRFRFDLPTGSYTLKVESHGFKDYTIDQVNVGPDIEVKLTIILTPGPPVSGPLEPPNTSVEKIEKIDAPPAEKIGARKIQ